MSDQKTLHDEWTRTTKELNPTTYELFLEQKIQSLKDELSAQEKTYEGAFENQRKNINGWKRRFKKEERKNIKQESQIKELENKISRLMDPHVIKPSELIKAMKEIKELREGIENIVDEMKKTDGFYYPLFLDIYRIQAKLEQLLKQ